jgi:hypothetical protein
MAVSNISKDSWQYENRAILFNCDEEAYQQAITLLSGMHGVHIWYTKSSRLRLVVEERGF